MGRWTTGLVWWCLTVVGVSEAVSARELTVTGEAIRSLVNAPTVRDVTLLADGSNAVLSATLGFANDCYADAGVAPRLLRAVGAVPHLLVLQRPDPEGCPDIFQPTDRAVVLPLPLEAASEAVRLIGRPAPSTVAIPVALQIVPRIPSPTQAPATLAALPPFAATGVSPAPAGVPGYVVSGEALLAPGCEALVVEAEVYEVPDAAGGPVFDVLVLRAPERCIGGGAPVALDIHVRTPQRLVGRSLYVVNERAPLPRGL